MSGTAEESAMHEPVDRLAKQWSSGRRPKVYDFTVRHERFFRLLSRFIWAADVRSFYARYFLVGHPDDTASRPIARTIGSDRIVDCGFRSLDRC